MGSVLHDQSEYGKAHYYYEQALVMFQKLYPPERFPQGNPALAGSLNDIGTILHDKGECGKALGYLEQALAMDKKLYPAERFPQGHPDLASRLNNLAGILRDQGEYGKAQDYFEQALAMLVNSYPSTRYPRGDPNLAVVLNNLGSLLEAQGEYGKAMSYYEQALAMRRKLYSVERFPYGHLYLANSMNNVGLLLKSQGEYAKALNHHLQSLTMLEKIFPPERYPQGHPQLAINLNNLGFVLQAQKEYGQALQRYEAALQSSRITADALHLQDGPSAAPSLQPLSLTIRIASNRGRLLASRLAPDSTTPEVRNAEKALALAIAVQDRLRAETLDRDDSKLLHGEESPELFPLRVGLCNRLFDLEKQPVDLHTAFATIEQGRARVFLESLGKTNAARLAGDLSQNLRDDESRLKQQIRAIDLRLRVLQTQPGDEAAAMARDLWQQRLKAEDDLTKFERTLAKSHPQYAALRYPQPCTVTDARKALDANEVAVLFAIGTDASYAVVVQSRPRENDPSDGIAIVCLPGRKILADKVAAITQRERLERLDGVRALGAELYQLLLQPLEKHLGDKDLLLVPDGPLGHLPFELLVEGGADGRYLIEKRRIRYAPSLTALHMIRLWEEGRQKQPAQPLFALGDPDFGTAQVATASRDALREVRLREGSGGMTFSRLKASGAEVRGLAKLFGTPGAVFTDDKATEAAVKKASAAGDLGRYRYVHFATHGILGVDRNEPPALILSLVGTTGQEDEYGRDDGFLKLPEVSALKLNADLVVLSACRTGQGRMHNGEGVSGLARVFLYAGSRGVVCSLWSVDDDATNELMQTMYKQLKEGKPTADALRAAKLAMIRDDQPPLFWAPFIHIGR